MTEKDQKHLFRSMFWDDYADDLAALDKRQRRRLRRKIGRWAARALPPDKNGLSNE